MSKVCQVGLTVCCLLLATFTSTLQAAQFTVLASSPPLALLVRSLVPANVSVESLMPPGTDPHHAHLSPAQVTALGRAELVVWQGPRWEAMLDKPMQRIAAEHQLVLEESIQSASGHPWLGEEPSVAIARTVSERLILSMPEYAEVIADLLVELEASLSASSRRAEQALSGNASRQFLALHDGYQPLVEQFRLQSLGYLVDDAGNRPGARSLWRISQQLEATANVCVFTQPQYSKDLLNGLGVEDRSVLVELDPMAGAAFEQGQDFADYYQALLEAMVRCLNGAG